MTPYFEPLSLRIHARLPGNRYRVWFCPKKAPYLAIEPATPEGIRSVNALVAEVNLRDPTPQRELDGALLVDDEGRFVFAGPGLNSRFLGVMARWLSEIRTNFPAVIEFADSGFVTTEAEVRSAEAIRDIRLNGSVERDESAWAPMLQSTLEGLDSLLASLVPGQQLWYWFSGNIHDDGVPLLLEPIPGDPMMTQLMTSIRHNATKDPVDALMGRCEVTTDGRLLFHGEEWTEFHLYVMGNWVRNHLQQSPGLARLSYAHAEAVHTNLDEVWQGVPPLTSAPFTIQDTAAFLQSKTKQAWFWLCTQDKNPHLAVLSHDADPKGTVFGERTRQLLHMVGQDNGFRGFMTRLSSSRLLFSTTEGTADRWQDAIRSFVGHHGSTHTSLSELSQSRFVRMTGDKITEARSL